MNRPVAALAVLLVAACSDDDERRAVAPGPDDPDPVNLAPSAVAGADQVRDEGTAVTLDGSGSTDPENANLAYAWTQVGGPPVALADADQARARFTAPSSYDPTLFSFRLRVTDPAGATAVDETAVTVKPVVQALAQYVDPRIGSYPPGFTNPGAVVPFGMVQLGPDTEGPIGYGGYYFHNALINGFSHVHMSAGVFKAGEIPVLPFTGALEPLPPPVPRDLNEYGWPGNVMHYASAYDKATETAQAGYYAVTLLRYGVRSELTASERVGMHRYTFNDPLQAPRVLVHVSRQLGEYGPGTARLGGDGVLTGHIDTHDGYPLFFALVADAPFTAATDGGTPLTGESSSRDNLGVVLDFPDAPGVLQLKVAISYTDEAGARANLAEIPDWDFDAVRTRATAKWNHALSRVPVEGGSESLKTSFYTALSRVFQWPNLHSDVDGRYRGPDGLVHAADGFPHYSQFSSWDSYRAQNAVQAEIFPHIYRDMVRSLLVFHQQAGHLPRWQQGPKDASHMTGDPIIPFIGEAWCRGQLDAALREALWPALAHLVTRRDPFLLQHGYLPDRPAPLESQPEVQPLMNLGSSGASATLEYGIGDFALALMAQSVPGSGAGAITQRALNYRKLMDPETGFVRPRLADGGWLTPFHPEFGWGFQEGTSWQYSWLAQHDYAGVIERMGGDAVAAQRLDTFFGFPVGIAPLAWPTLQNQITAFGIWYGGNQYAPGNEHDLQAPYAYLYTSEAWKTPAVARAAASIYTPTPNGLPGNDDLGALSGWLVWTLAGLYPGNPGTPLYVAGSPHFTRVTFKRPTGDLVIEAPGAYELARFVSGIEVNGVATDRSWLVAPPTATTVRLVVSAVPDTAWAATPEARPPSLSTHPLTAFGCTP